MSSASVVYQAFGKHNSCGDCSLGRKCLGRSLAPSELDALRLLEVSPRLFRRGDHLFRTGDGMESLYVVKSGAVKTYVMTSDGDEQVIGFHMPGDIIALDAVAGGSHACSAMALDTTCVCTLSFDELADLCSRSTTLQRAVLRWMSHEIVRDENMVLMLAKLNAEQRMATFLLGQAEHQAQRGFSGTEFNLAMSRADVGNYLGLAVETVSRVLTRFQSAGVIEVHRNKVKIHDAEALGSFAHAAVSDAGAASHRRVVALH